jgi:hypothetical protein
MRTFDLKAALRGEKVVTRDGREVTTVLQPDGLAKPYTVAAVINGALYSYTESGVYEVGDPYEVGDCSTRHDLFMATKTVTKYSNLYSDALGAAYTGALWPTAADAEKNAIVLPKKDRIAVATVTWEE